MNIKFLSCKLFFIPFLLVILLIFFLITVDGFINSMLMFFGLSLIVCYISFFGIKDLFSPFFLFSIFYILVYVAAYHTGAVNFSENNYLNSTIFYSDKSEIYTLTLLICNISYLSALTGFLLFDGRSKEFKPYPIKNINSITFLFFIGLFFSVGMVNFFYNIYSFYGGNIFDYYLNISMRASDFEQAGSTLGYNFLYASAYMLFIRSIQTNRSKLFTYLIISVSILVFSSNGRIIQTLLYILSFYLIHYYNNGSEKLNKKIIILYAIIPLVGILFYFARLASSLNSSNMFNFSNGGIFDFLSNIYSFEILAYFLIEKGNLPNFAVLMKVVDSWGHDIGYLFGSTLLFPFYGFFSSNLFGYIEVPAVAVKNLWYSGVPGGNLPITIMGEMFANFYLLGPTVGMFVFGVLGAFLKKLFFYFQSNTFIIFYAQFCFFYMITPKGEFNNFNLFWFFFASMLFNIVLILARTFEVKKI